MIVVVTKALKALGKLRTTGDIFDAGDSPNVVKLIEQHYLREATASEAAQIGRERTRTTKIIGRELAEERRTRTSQTAKGVAKPQPSAKRAPVAEGRRRRSRMTQPL